MHAKYECTHKARASEMKWHRINRIQHQRIRMTDMTYSSKRSDSNAHAQVQDFAYSQGTYIDRKTCACWNRYNRACLDRKPCHGYAHANTHTQTHRHTDVNRRTLRRCCRVSFSFSIRMRSSRISLSASCILPRICGTETK